jgi:glycolate oxidase
MSSIAEDMRIIAEGEILDDEWTRRYYSVDASHYSIMPSLVVFPVNQEDVSAICKYAFSKNVSLTARGAGTGLLGQSLSQNIIIDFTKYMNKITEIGNNYVVVQPGIVKGVLDKELKRKGKFLPPDPASSNYCTIGGMVANNASGPHALGFGSIIDFLEGVTVVYSDGSIGTISDNDSDDRMTRIFRLLGDKVDLIRQRYPKVTKNSCGYRLDSVINNDKFYPQKLFAASEGTLGILTSVRLKILDLPDCRQLLVLGFNNLLSAVSVIPSILLDSPVAVELLDHTVLGNVDKDGLDHSHVETILFVEFAGRERKRIELQAACCKDRLVGKCRVLESASDEKSINRIWESRKSALNHVMKLTIGSRRPIGLIEDTVVHTDFLLEYIRFLIEKYAKNNLDYVFYGHAGNGNLHTRPMIDLDSQSEIRMIEHLAEQVFKKVISLRGTISGEHGDGLGRVNHISHMYGTQIYSLFLGIKELLDPTYIMNPGKKILKQNK